MSLMNSFKGYVQIFQINSLNLFHEDEFSVIFKAGMCTQLLFKLFCLNRDCPIEWWTSLDVDGPCCDLPLQENLPFV